MSFRVSHCGDVHIEEERYFGDTAHCLEWYVADSIHSNASLFVVNGDLTTYKATSQRDRDPRTRAVLQFGPCDAQRCGFPLFGLRDTCGAQRGKMLSAPLSLTCSQRSQLPSWRRFDQSMLVKKVGCDPNSLEVALPCGRCCARAFQQKYVEIGGQRFGVELPHHHGDLTAMIRGVVDQMLHQVRQTELCCAKREHFFQRFLCHGIYELRLLFLDFRPLQPYRCEVRKCVRTEEGIVSIPQIR